MKLKIKLKNSLEKNTVLITLINSKEQNYGLKIQGIMEKN